MIGEPVGCVERKLQRMAPDQLAATAKTFPLHWLCHACRSPTESDALGTSMQFRPVALRW